MKTLLIKKSVILEADKLATRRARFQPANAAEYKAADSTAVAWLGHSKTGSGLIVAVGFSGRRARPDFNYSYRNEAPARAKIADHAAGVKLAEEHRRNHAAQRQAGAIAI